VSSDPRRPGGRPWRPWGLPLPQAPCPGGGGADTSPSWWSTSWPPAGLRCSRPRCPTQTRPRRPPRGPARRRRRETIVPAPEYLDVPVLPWCTCSVLRPLRWAINALSL